MAWIKGKRRLNKEAGRNEMYYSIEWREHGRIKSKSLGFVGKPEAERLLKLFEGRRAAGQPVEPEPPPSAPSSPAPMIPRLREFLTDTFLPVVERDRAPKTHETHARAAKALTARLGDRALDEVSYAVVDAYVTARKRDGRRSRTIILELRTLSSALKYAVDLGLLEAVPKLPRIQDRDRQPHRYLTVEESVALLEAMRPLDEQPHAVTRGKPPITRDRLSYLAVLMALNTGMRRGEILSRRWTDIRFADGPHGSIRVAAQAEIGFRVKTRDERVVSMTPDLRQELEAEWQRVGSPLHAWVFPSSADPSQPRDNFAHALALGCKRAGLPRMHPHSLRHTWATRLAMAGVDRRTLMDLGGWKTGQMLDEVYAHSTDPHRAEVMSRTGVGARPRCAPDADRRDLRDSTAGQSDHASPSHPERPTPRSR